MRYDRHKADLERHIKGLDDLKKRRSHADHETDRALAAMANSALDVPARRIILAYRYHRALRRACAQHASCCNTDL